jgi:outer membrane protein assembly factor BamA
MASIVRCARVGALAYWAACAWARAETGPAPSRTEVGAFPLAGGNSDVGWGGGAIGSLTRIEPGFGPYRWRLEFNGLATFQHTDEKGWSTPYQDYYLLWTDPHLIRDRLRLELRPSYTEESTLLYYGIGNDAPAGEAASDHYRYGRAHPRLMARLQFSVAPGLYFLTGLSLTYNRMEIHGGSKLEQDLDTPGGPRRAPTRHAVALFEYAAVLDARDDEIDTHEGAFHQLKLRLSPGGTSAFPYRYGQLNATARFYTTPVRPWITIAVRVVADALFGDPPFYELARYEDTNAIGGVRGVRGVPAQRYYGKLKAFGNLEVRSEILTTTIGAKEYAVGLAAFFDAGRVWSDWSPDPARDGTGLGLKWGIGAGLRFRQGNTFVVRGDVAWSPDATPIGAYFAAGQIF